LEDETGMKILKLEDLIKEKDSYIELLEVQVKSNNQSLLAQKDKDIQNLKEQLEAYKN
jgi:hypothetical protein